MPEAYAGNLLSWMEQVLIIASLGSLLLIVFRIRHPRTQLAYCHILLAVCLALPFIQPWRHPVVPVKLVRTFLQVNRPDAVAPVDPPARSPTTAAAPISRKRVVAPPPEPPPF